MSKKTAAELFDIKNPVHFLALGFGSGLSPKAPGTMGTLAAIPLFLLCAQLPFYAFIALTLLISIVGIWICDKASKDAGVHDHGAIVWDEIAGFFITMIAIPVSWQSIIVGFILFRIFDILKPWPISIADKQVAGGFGIMLDDIIAGILACALMHLIF
ncbi:phosphatidylglycerophosphatase A family protein [Thalassotalea sp. ND16A]|uniref:phosphatidylglycerophosphatase A family protein n=1 Tax=Thalassotalea sp. ND16A TaxID=1535422 RepID=UPI000519F1FA|nr:phosphatidylglycerophosphatase A [Thalassotalea sp. ND16A]KGJ90281.1 Phosphatidylglycerophosphatase [Thalassotalea sp. ND16A]